MSFEVHYWNGRQKYDNIYCKSFLLVAPIDHVYGTLGLVKATSTQKYSDISKLRPEIEGSGSFTIFAPSNDAWELLDEVSGEQNKHVEVFCVSGFNQSLSHHQEVRSALVSNVNIELYNALHYHMANKRLFTKDLRNGMTVTSMYNDLGLQINHYSNGVSILFQDGHSRHFVFVL